MKTLFSALLVGLISIAFIYAPGEGETINIGDKAPKATLKMKDVSGAEISLKDKMGDQGLLVIFSCNTCPFVVGRADSEGWEGRYNNVAQQAESHGIGSILVNSNEAKRGDEDSFEKMVERASENRYLMAYVVDKDHVIADAFGARTTPHVFLFNNKFELVYKGAIDDNNDSSDEVKEH